MNCVMLVKAPYICCNPPSQDSWQLKEPVRGLVTSTMEMEYLDIWSRFS